MPVAIGTLAMLVGNVGLQIFNNWRNSRQSSELQQKHEEFEQAVRVSDGPGSLMCCSPWGHKESDTTERLN